VIFYRMWVQMFFRFFITKDIAIRMVCYNAGKSNIIPRIAGV